MIGKLNKQWSFLSLSRSETTCIGTQPKTGFSQSRIDLIGQ